MSKRGKLVQRFLTMPSDFTWQELVTMLKGFGYEQVIGAKSGGSRVKFLHQALPPISLHKPHPTSILKRYQLEQIEEILKGEDLI
ncbi:MAG: type II toxin-antitoxin system HicA family toxin [Syntrophobacteraceae bacterium]